MKVSIILAVMSAAALLAVDGTVQAKPTPVEIQPAAWSDAADAYSGPAAALREQAYFQAPQPSSYAGKTLPCRLHWHVFDKPQGARACD